MKKQILKISLFSMLLAVAGQASATICGPTDPANNCAPPAGAILDLAGQHSGDTYVNYTVSFVAGSALTTLTFAQRSDPGAIFLDDVSLTGTGPNLVANGGFEDGSFVGVDGNAEPIGWTYTDPNHAGVPGRLNCGSAARTGNCEYDDPSVSAYDFLSQDIATTIGDTYTISFYAYHSGGSSTIYQDEGSSTVDLLVYASNAQASTAVPEPGSIALLGLGIAGLAVTRRRKAR